LAAEKRNGADEHFLSLSARVGFLGLGNGVRKAEIAQETMLDAG